MTHAGPVAPAVERTPQSAPLTVLGYVRNELLRSGLLSMLRERPGLSVEIYSESDGPDVAELARHIVSGRVDLVLVSSTAAVNLTARIVEIGRRHDVRVVLLLRTAAEWLTIEDEVPAVNGIILEADLTRDVLGDAMSQVMRGDLPVPAALAEHLLTEVRRSRRHQADRSLPVRPTLTPREGQALHLLVDGLSNKQIARRLGISENGAKRHVANVLAKLNCANRTCAAATALRWGLVQEPELPNEG